MIPKNLSKHFSPTLFVVGIAAMASCEWAKTDAGEDSLQSEYIMECELVAHSYTFGAVKRCLNDEVICYTSNNGISCIRSDKR
jgi:hypothetical protein